MDGCRRHKPPGSETKDFVSHCKRSVMNFVVTLVPRPLNSHESDVEVPAACEVDCFTSEETPAFYNEHLANVSDFCSEVRHCIYIPEANKPVLCSKDRSHLYLPRLFSLRTPLNRQS